MRKIIRLKPIAFIESFKEVLQVKITKRAPKSITGYTFILSLKNSLKDMIKETIRVVRI